MNSIAPTVTRSRLSDKLQTARSMYSMVDKFSQDLAPLENLSLAEFFTRVANMTYHLDPKGREVVARPRWALAMARKRGIDCKKKAILMASFLKLKGIPFRFIGSSSKKPSFFNGTPRIHHVFPQARICDETKCDWRNVDATYPHYRLFAAKPGVTRAVVFQGATA